MTGEMIKPKNADRGEDYWEGKLSWCGSYILGDETYLIRPNYPDFFELRDEIRKIDYKNADVQPFDVYQGPYIDLLGINVGKTPYEGLSLTLSKIVGGCQVWKEGEDLWRLDCGENNKKFFETEKPFIGDKGEILSELKKLKRILK